MTHDLADVGAPDVDRKVQGKELLGRSTKPASTLGVSVDVLVVNTVRAGACRDASRQNDSLIDSDSGPTR